MRLAVITAQYKRPKLTNLIFKYYNLLQRQLTPSIDLRLISVGSEGEHSQAIAKANRWQYLEYPNQPLNHKWREGFKAAKIHDPDGCLLVGTDDIISPALLLNYKDLLESERQNLGLLDTYSLNLQHFTVGHWPGYGFPGRHALAWWAYQRLKKRRWKSPPFNRGKTAGSAQLFTAETLDKLRWDLWGPKPIPKGLDGQAWERLKAHGETIQGHKLADLEGCFMSVKTARNLTPNIGPWALNRSWLTNPVQFIEDRFGVGLSLDLFKLHQQGLT